MGDFRLAGAGRRAGFFAAGFRADFFAAALRAGFFDIDLRAAFFGRAVFLAPLRFLAFFFAAMVTSSGLR